MSGSSFSSLLGVSFRLPFRARGQPDKLDTEIIKCQTRDEFSRAHACMEKIRLFGRVDAFKSRQSRVETRPRSCQSQNVTSVFHPSFNSEDKGGGGDVFRSAGCKSSPTFDGMHSFL